MIKALALERMWPAVFLKPHHRVINKQTSVSSWKLWLSIGLIAANAVLLMNYIYGVNQFASQGYQIGVLQKRLATLTADNKQMNLKIAQATSMVTIKNDFLSANYVPASTPKFLQTGGELTVNR
jgi:hypothetical protein